MIEYVNDPSPFYLANKSYCQQVESGLRELGAEPVGFCNSYGYDIRASVIRDKLIYQLHFEKHQSTQNGVVIPVDALDYAGITIEARGLAKRYKVRFGQSPFLRFLMSGERKAQLPPPYFAILNKAGKSPGIQTLRGLPRLGISSLSIDNGHAICKIHTPVRDPGALIESIAPVMEAYS